MAYNSQVPEIWTKLSFEGSIRKRTPSRATFDHVCQAFYQAEECPMSTPTSRDVRLFRAEYNIWAYYFGENLKFPGIDPAICNDTSSFSVDGSDFSPQKDAISPGARQVKQQLESNWAARPKRAGYQPQLGWNPTTGEPWMAVRSYATNSYPALSGPRHSFLHQFQDMNRDFVVQYERFPEQGNTLIWLEFNDPAKIMNQRIWEKLGELRSFLAEWAGHTGAAPNIHEAYKDFCARPVEERPSLPLPQGFVLDRNRACSLPATGYSSKKVATSAESRQRSPRRQSFQSDGTKRRGLIARGSGILIDRYRPRNYDR